MVTQLPLLIETLRSRPGTFQSAPASGGRTVSLRIEPSEFGAYLHLSVPREVGPGMDVHHLLAGVRNGHAVVSLLGPHLVLLIYELEREETLPDGGRRFRLHGDRSWIEFHFLPDGKLRLRAAPPEQSDASLDVLFVS
jgi:hypothetical protein